MSAKNIPPTENNDNNVRIRRISRGFSFSAAINDYDEKGRKRLWITTFLLRLLNKAIKKDETLEALLEKKAKKSYVYLTYFMGKFAFVCALFYFTYTGIIADQNLRFIALDQSVGICRSVPTVISGNFAMDSNGNYQGTQNFDAAKAYYYIELSNFQHDIDGYQKFMDQARDIVYRLSKIAPKMDLGMSLVYWTSYANEINDGNYVHYFRFNANPIAVYDRFYKTGFLSDFLGDCDLAPDVSYNSMNGVLTMVYSEKEFMSHKNCSGAIDPAAMGYQPEDSGDKFEINVDTRSLVTAFALNSDIMMPGILVDVNLWGISNVTIGCLPELNTPGCTGDLYTFRAGIDPDLPGMDPVVCLIPTKRNRPDSSYYFKNLCAMKVADQFVYPYTFHFGLSGVDGNNPYIPRQCNCSDPVDSSNDHCDNFDLILGFLQWEQVEATPVKAFYYMLDMAYRYDNTFINKAMYNGAFASIRVGGHALEFPPPRPPSISVADYNASRDLLSSQQFRSSIFDVCNDSCNSVAFRLFDTKDRKVNLDFLQVHHGGCSDSFWTGEDTWKAAKLVPFAPLVQDYVECVNTLQQSIIVSFGSAFGVAAPITTAFVMMFVFFIGKIHDFYLRRKDQVYTADTNGTITMAENVHMVDVPISSQRPKKGDNVYVSTTSVGVVDETGGREAVVLLVNSDGSVDLRYTDNGERQNNIEGSRVVCVPLAVRPSMNIGYQSKWPEATAPEVGGGGVAIPATRRRSRSEPNDGFIEEL